MKLLTLLLSCLLAVLLPGASAKKGGGGSGDGDSNGDSNGGGSGGGSSGGSSSGDSSGDSSGGSSSGDESCGIADPPPIWKWDLLPFHAQNNTGMEGVGLGYGGSFFKGEASVDYLVTASQRCRMDNFRSTHMLGYAWIGPQPSYPTGPTNAIIIGFKAWETGLSLENIDDSYAYIKKDQYCPKKPDLFRVATSHGWLNSTARTSRAADFMNMTLANSAVNSDQALFNATMKEELGFKPTDDGLLLTLPRGACPGFGDYKFRLPDQLTMNGSFTNTTLNLTLSGRGNATGRGFREAEATAEFKITFTGVFDSANSTHKIDVKPQGEPLVAWVQSSSLREAAMNWSSMVVFLAATLLLI